MKRICPQCQAPAEGNFCGYCGFKFNEKKAKAEEEQPTFVSIEESLPTMDHSAHYAQLHSPRAMGVTSNIIMGTIGALIGAAIGAALFTVVMSLGYYSSLVGLVISVLTTMGYKKLGKVLDFKGMVICVIIMLAAVYVGVRFGYAYVIAKAWEENIFTAFGETTEVLDMFDMMGDFAQSMVMGYVFTALGAVGTLVNGYREYAGIKKVKKK